MTDGVLFRETLVDPLLSRYSVIMVRRSPVHLYTEHVLTSKTKDR